MCLRTYAYTLHQSLDLCNIAVWVVGQPVIMATISQEDVINDLHEYDYLWENKPMMLGERNDEIEMWPFTSTLTDGDTPSSEPYSVSDNEHGLPVSPERSVSAIFGMCFPRILVLRLLGSGGQLCNAPFDFTRFLSDPFFFSVAKNCNNFLKYIVNNFHA